MGLAFVTIHRTLRKIKRTYREQVGWSGGHIGTGPLPKEVVDRVAANRRMVAAS
jgi:hypothetical protein